MQGWSCPGRGAGEEDVIEVLVSLLCGSDEYPEIPLYLVLADEFIETRGPEGGLKGSLLGLLSRLDRPTGHPQLR